MGSNAIVPYVVRQCFKCLFLPRAKGIEKKSYSTDKFHGDDSREMEDDNNFGENDPDPHPRTPLKKRGSSNRRKRKLENKS